MKLAFDREVLYSSVFAIERHPSWIRLNYMSGHWIFTKSHNETLFSTFFKIFIIPYLFYFFCSLFFFSARRCARNCVLAYRELRAWHKYLLTAYVVNNLLMFLSWYDILELVVPIRISFFFWPLCCLSFIDLGILITLLVSPNSF